MKDAVLLSWRSIQREVRWYRYATWRQRWDHFAHGLRGTDPGNWSSGPPV